jgi:hypothetical protein
MAVVAQGAFGTDCSAEGISRFIDILLRKAETSAIILGDGELDRRS